jgi:hypothetical protein
MSDDDQRIPIKFDATDLAELKKIFGPAPVLSTESSEAYDALLARFMECINPEDFVVQMLVNDLAIATWDIFRYTRHKTLAIERKFRQRLEFQATRDKTLAQRREARAQKEKDGKPATVGDQRLELEIVVDSTVDDVVEILKRTPKELDHARALEDGLEYHERLYKFYSMAVALRNDALEQISLYRESLGLHLRRVSDTIIDGEFSETKPEEIPLVPSTE